MPHRTFDIEEVARYLHLSRADIERLVKNRDVPFERHGKRLVFQKIEIDAWASQRILGLQGSRLADYHDKSSQATRDYLPHEAIFPEMLQPEFIQPAMPAKTKASVMREMAALAGKTRRVCDPAGLLSSLEAREALCSTGLPGGMALLHCRSPESYLFDSPFIVLGRTVQEIPFGAPDGQPTRLFFLVCCPDDRLHLHTLARLCLVAQKTDLLLQLGEARDSPAIYCAIIAAEEEVLKRRRASSHA